MNLSKRELERTLVCKKKLDAAIKTMSEVGKAEDINGQLVRMACYGRNMHDLGEPVSICGTVACAAGWVALDPAARKVFDMPKLPHSNNPRRFVKEFVDDPFMAAMIAERDGAEAGFNAPSSVDARIGDLDQLFGTDSSIGALRYKLNMPSFPGKCTAADWLSTAREMRKRLNKLLASVPRG